MTEQPNSTPKHTKGKHFSVPAIEDGGLDDRTVASPALGFGMDRVDFLDEHGGRASLTSDSLPEIKSAEQEEAQQAAEQAMRTLASNEVAAVSMDRSYYVSDVPSPYLSTRQALEDVDVTRRRHSRTSVVLIVLVTIAFLGGLGWFAWQSIPHQEAKPHIHYDTVEIEKDEYLETVDTTSLVRPANEVVITAEVSGTVAQSFVEEGSGVQEGSSLFQLDNPIISEAATKAQEALDSLQKEVDSKSTALDEANEAVTKAQEAVDADTEGTDTAAKVTLETAKTRAETAQADLDAANKNLADIQETYDRAQEQQKTLSISSPIAGTVSELSPQAKEGGTVSSSTRLCTVSDTSRYSIQMEVPLSAKGRVNVGQEVRLSFPGIEDLDITSQISSLDESDEMLLATVLIDEPDDRIAIGTASEARIIIKSIPDAYIVPLKAIRTDTDGSTHLDVVIDASRNIVTDVPITIVATDGTQAAIEADNIQAGNPVLIPGGTN